MDGTSQTWVERADNAPDLKGIVFVLYLGADQRLLYRTWLSFVILGPSSRCLAPRTGSWRFSYLLSQSSVLEHLWHRQPVPCRWLRRVCIVYVSWFTGLELEQPAGHRISHIFSYESPGSMTTEDREQSLGAGLELGEHGVNHAFSLLAHRWHR